MKEQFNIKTNLFYNYVYVINGDEMRKEKSDLDAFWKIGRIDGKDLAGVEIEGGKHAKRTRDRDRSRENLDRAAPALSAMSLYACSNLAVLLACTQNTQVSDDFRRIRCAYSIASWDLL
jgi:hypothetical protein